MTTNILIVGNGFDLSHYVPTKYDHFMVAMQAIENWNKEEDMGFDDLFDVDYKKEDYFFQKTKEIYDTNEIKIAINQIEKLKEQLKENGWYQYFKKHIEDIDTWIDFETQIQKLLKYFSDYLVYLENKNNVNTLYDISKIQQVLSLFKLFVLQVTDRKLSNGIDQGVRNKPTQNLLINYKFCYKENIQNGFDRSCFLNFLQIQLNDFIEIFNLYLKLIIDQLKPNFTFNIQVLKKEQLLFSDNQELVNVWKKPNKIYSFNYTNSYQKFYDKETDIEFLHGKFGKNQNIVLGVDDLTDDVLKEIKAYGFTKYHQKLFKDTDYLFLDEYKKKIENIQRKIIDLKQQKADCGGGVRARSYQQEIDKNLNKYNLDLKFYIWGHSLDVSDRDYIIDLFSLNDDLDRNVRIVVYYFDANAKFALLNNLLAILGKDKVEHWMKNRWLKFEKNPKINFGIAEMQSSAS